MTQCHPYEPVAHTGAKRVHPDEMQTGQAVVSV